MNKSESKHRRKLNTEQLEVLELLYKFRFGSNDLFAQYFGKKDRSFVFKRLSILLDQELIGKRFDSSYRIQGKPAAYYLTPKGGRILQEYRDSDDSPVNAKALYRLPTVKDGFVEHCLDLFAIYLKFRAMYGDKLHFSTKIDLNIDDFDYFPQPVPDAYIRIDLSDDKELQFFLDLYDEGDPFFTAVRRIISYIEYSDSGEWATTETDLPAILAVCSSASLQKRLRKRIVLARDKAWDTDTVFALTTKAELLSSNITVWQPAEEPEEKITLEEISLQLLDKVSLNNATI